MNVSVRRLAPWHLLMVLGFGVFGAAVAGLAGHNSIIRRHVAAPFFFPPTGFGGYNWVGAGVNQISARWSVPSVSTQLQWAYASTWIGIQQLSAQGFIQVGTTESAYGPKSSTATIFWSDTQNGFHPQTLTAVNHGDVIAASMVRRSGGWELGVRDMTTKTAYSVVVPDNAHTTFNVAEYTQEDPPPSLVSSGDLPYPTTSTVTFDHLLVNGRAQTLVRAEGTVLMSPNGIDLVPTPEADDGFSLVPAQGEAAQYLRVASRFDTVSLKFSYDLSRWQRVTLGQRQAAVDALMTGLADTTRTVESLSAPSASAKTDFVALTDSLERELTLWRAQGLSQSDTAYRSVAKVSHSVAYERAVDQIRASLGLPPP